MLSSKDLSEVERLKGLNPKCYKSLIAGASALSLKRGAELFCEGEGPIGVYIILKGSIKVSKALNNGGEFVFDIFFPGESLGEVSLLSQQNYLATAVALEDTRILKINKKAYLSVFEGTNPAVMKVVEELCLRIRQQHRRIGELSAGDVEKRMASVILSISERTHPSPAKQTIVNLSRQELSAMVGARIETVIRIVSKWISSGIAEKRTRGFKVKTELLREMIKSTNDKK